MRSPARGLSPSDGEEVSDSAPLLQGAPQAEAGEQRSGPGASGGRPSRRECGQSARAPSRWVQSGLGRGSRELGVGESRERGDLSPPAPGPQAERREARVGPRQVQPRGARAGSYWAPGDLRLYRAWGPLWKHGLGENLQIDG